MCLTKRATIVHFEPRFLPVQISLTLQQMCQRPVILIIERSLVISCKWRHENPQFAHNLYSHVICIVLTTYTNTFLNTLNRPPFIMKAVKAFCKVRGSWWGNRRPLGRPRRRWVDNIRTDLQEVGCAYMDWIGLAQDRDRWRKLVSAVMNLRVPWNAGNFLTSFKPVSFSRRTLHHGVSK